MTEIVFNWTLSLLLVAVLLKHASPISHKSLNVQKSDQYRVPWSFILSTGVGGGKPNMYQFGCQTSIKTKGIVVSVTVLQNN